MALIAELMVLPVPNPTPMSAFAAETGWMSHRMEDFEHSRDNAGVFVERVSLLATPIGHITISYLEGSNSYRDVAKTIRTTPTVFDQDMMTRGKVLHGLSEEQQREKRIPLETSVYYRSPAVSSEEARKPWHSFAALLPSSALPQWEAFRTELNGPRLSEFESFNESNGFSVVCMGLYQRSEGTLACFYIEGTDDVNALPKALAREGAFEDWLATRLEAIHGSNFREGVPSPAVGVPWDWVKGEANEVVAPLFARVTRLLGE
jgi:hypothetical protein